MRKVLLLSAVAMMAFASCKKNDKRYDTTGTEGTASNMSYQLVAINKSGTVQEKTTAGNIAWTAGYANPRMIKFEAKQDHTEIEYKSTNTNQIDLMAPAELLFGGFTLPNGVYDEIEVKILLDKDGSAAALQLQGQYTNGTLSFPVLVVIDDNIELKTEQKNVTISDNTPLIAITTIDLFEATAGLRGSMLENATFTNGVMEISRSKNRSIYNMILDNLRSKRHKCKFEHRKK